VGLLGAAALSAVVLLVPLAKGGMAPAWWSAWLGLSLAVVLIPWAWPMRRDLVYGSEQNGDKRHQFHVLVLPFAALTGWLFIQLAVGAVLGARDMDVVSQSSIMSVGAANNSDLAGWWARGTGYWAIVLLAAGLARKGVRVVLVALLAIVIFETLYGLVAFGGDQTTILGIWPKVAYLRDVTGTFVNKNHFAGFLACGLPLALGLLALRRSRGGLFESSALRYGSIGVVALIAGAALLASHSRLGAVAALIGLMVWLAIASRLEPRSDARLPRWLPYAVGGVIISGGLWFGVGPLVARFMTVAQDSRYEAWEATFNLPWHSWLFGIGPAAFEDVFRFVQPASDARQWRYAHNDYLQFVLEMGVIGTALIAAAFVYWAKRSWPGLRHPLQAAALGGVTAIAVHSAGDFNLHIPGVAVVFWLAVGILFNNELGRGRGGGASAGLRRDGNV